MNPNLSLLDNFIGNSLQFGGQQSSAVQIFIGLFLLLVLIFGGFAMYKLLNGFGNIVKDIEQFSKDATTTLGKGFESIDCCILGNCPQNICTKDNIDNTEKTYGQESGGYDVCTKCQPECLMYKLDCTKFDTFLGLGIFGAFLLGPLLKTMFTSSRDKGVEDAKNENGDADPSGETEMDKDGETMEKSVERLKKASEKNGKKPKNLDEANENIQNDSKIFQKAKAEKDLIQKEQQTDGSSKEDEEAEETDLETEEQIQEQEDKDAGDDEEQEMEDDDDDDDDDIEPAE